MPVVTRRDGAFAFPYIGAAAGHNLKLAANIAACTVPTPRQLLVTESIKLTGKASVVIGCVARRRRRREKMPHFAAGAFRSPHWMSRRLVHFTKLRTEPVQKEAPQTELSCAANSPDAESRT